jgi:hypothetical protein
VQEQDAADQKQEAQDRRRGRSQEQER